MHIRTVGDIRQLLNGLDDSAPLWFVINDDNARDGQRELVVVDANIDHEFGASIGLDEPVAVDRR